MTFKLTLPPRTGSGGAEVIETLNNSIVFIGSNGAGKSRLGAWIDENNTKKVNDIDIEVHRIAAQRSLSVPERINLLAPKRANDLLFYGSDRPEILNNKKKSKRTQRWGTNRATTMLLSDYDKLLQVLLSRRIKRNEDFFENSKLDPNYQRQLAPDEILTKIWTRLFPNIEVYLDTNNGKLIASSRHGIKFAASEMSDGERVAVYLIGQCLCAPLNAILVIDEPEIHLHKSLMVSLWDELEKERNDCLFVYLTHDLSFASSRTTAIKIWVKNYNNNAWQWETIEQVDDLPEELILQVIGSPIPVIFVEADLGNYDYKIYSALFPNHLIIPMGGSRDVKKSVKALRMLVNKFPELSHLKPMGLIDRDYRTKEEIDGLKEQMVFCLKVAEVENLFCIEGVIEIVANIKSLDAKSYIDKLKQEAFNSLSKNIEEQATKLTHHVVENKMLNELNGKHNTKSDLINSIDNLQYLKDFANQSYEENINRLNTIIKTSDYESLLVIYNHKSLPHLVAKVLEEKGKSSYMDWVIRILQEKDESANKQQLHDAILPYIPHQLR